MCARATTHTSTCAVRRSPPPERPRKLRRVEAAKEYIISQADPLSCHTPMQVFADKWEVAKATVSRAVQDLEDSGAADIVRAGVLPGAAGGAAAAAAVDVEAADQPEEVRNYLAQKWAVTNYKKVVYGKGFASVATQAARKFGLPPGSVCASTVKRHVNKGKTGSPLKSGPKLIIPLEHETKLAETVRLLRAMKLPVLKIDIITYAADLIKGTPSAAKFRDGIPTASWYAGFLKRHGLNTDAPRPVELPRAQWLTSGNAHEMYTVCADVLVEAGIAVINPDYDPECKDVDDPKSQPVFLTRPELFFSFDETGTPLDMTGATKAASASTTTTPSARASMGDPSTPAPTPSTARRMTRQRSGA